MHEGARGHAGNDQDHYEEAARLANEGGQDRDGNWILGSKNSKNPAQGRKLYGGYGDIIAWNDAPEPAQMGDPSKVQRDFQSNPSIISHAEPAVNDERTQGRRVYGKNPRPTPFGTDADIGRHGDIYPATSQLRRGYKGYDK